MSNPGKISAYEWWWCVCMTWPRCVDLFYRCAASIQIQCCRTITSLYTFWNLKGLWCLIVHRTSFDFLKNYTTLLRTLRRHHHHSDFGGSLDAETKVSTHSDERVLGVVITNQSRLRWFNYCLWNITSLHRSSKQINERISSTSCLFITSTSIIIITFKSVQAVSWAEEFR